MQRLTLAETRAALAALGSAPPIRRARCAPYLESDLQAYVAAHFESDLGRWLGADGPMQAPVQLLGQHVPCSAGELDLLASIAGNLVIVELKAQPVTERVVGQVMRYKLAVENFLSWQVWQAARARGLRGPVYETETRVMCLVIGPSYEPTAGDTLADLGWPFVAQPLDNGDFVISPYDLDRHPVTADGELARLTAPYVADQVDWWATRARDHLCE
jgi:Holliday junction resolvase-like predicted endonuclease